MIFKSRENQYPPSVCKLHIYIYTRTREDRIDRFVDRVAIGGEASGTFIHPETHVFP